MKLKNINATLLILVSLLCLSLAFFVSATENSNGTKNIFLDSDQDGLTDAEEKTYGTDAKKADTDNDGYSDGAEIKAGYDPLKKAPGDKLTTSPVPAVKGESITNKEKKQNLTEQVAQKISTITSQAGTDDQEVGMEEIQTLLDSVMNGESFKNELPEISKDSIKILKQNYGNLSKEKSKEKMKEDVTNYFVSILYIFTSNSPKPLTSASDTNAVINQVVTQISTSLTSGDPSNLADLSQSGGKIYEQLKEVSVPEDMVDTQIKALQYGLYAQELKNLIKIDPADPLSNLANYSKIATFVQSLNSFYDEIQNKMNDYGIDSENVQNKLNDKGISTDIFEK
ncbi:MAG: hypothetical protein WC678_02290 [Parcubacteria group bacterium]|jgi:hypothetical protein